jgi:hypothetical protein
MAGSRSNLATNFKLRAVVREFSGALTAPTSQAALPADAWPEVAARVDLLGAAQVSQNMPDGSIWTLYADYCTGNLTTTPRGVQREATYDERCRLR